jgi:FkbM family methyltransferase
MFLSESCDLNYPPESRYKFFLILFQVYIILPKMNFYYGIENNYLDITEKVKSSCINSNNILVLPADDGHRAAIFTDPLVGIPKHVMMKDEQGNVTIYPGNQPVCSRIDNGRNVIDELGAVHSKLKCMFGSVLEEYTEQLMARIFVNPNDTVLEIGGNIGRNSLNLATIVDNSKLVVLETDPNISRQLIQNRDLNGFTFHVEDSALSYRKLVQRGWDTYPRESVDPNALSAYTEVKTITFEELEAKYNVKFDTIVADCEGALYYIFMDNPHVLDNVKLIVMENDYHDINHKTFVDGILKAKGFSRSFVQAGGWGCCYNVFYETWEKK